MKQNIKSYIYYYAIQVFSGSSSSHWNKDCQCPFVRCIHWVEGLEAYFEFLLVTLIFLFKTFQCFQEISFLPIFLNAVSPTLQSFITNTKGAENEQYQYHELCLTLILKDDSLQTSDSCSSMWFKVTGVVKTSMSYQPPHVTWKEPQWGHFFIQLCKLNLSNWEVMNKCQNKCLEPVESDFCNSPQFSPICVLHQLAATGYKLSYNITA